MAIAVFTALDLYNIRNDAAVGRIAIGRGNDVAVEFPFYSGMNFIMAGIQIDETAGSFLPGIIGKPFLKLIFGLAFQKVKTPEELFPQGFCST